VRNGATALRQASWRSQCACCHQMHATFCCMVVMASLAIVPLTINTWFATGAHHRGLPDADEPAGGRQHDPAPRLHPPGAGTAACHNIS